MTVAHILDGKAGAIITAAPHDTVAEVARLLNEHRIGAVMIDGVDGRPGGIFTERDLVRVLAVGGAEALADPVSRHMTRDLVTTTEDTGVVEIMTAMTRGKFRHVPVLRDGRVVGIVSIGDVVKHRLTEVEVEHRALRDYIASA